MPPLSVEQPGSLDVIVLANGREVDRHPLRFSQEHRGHGQAELSAEPDIAFVSHEALLADRVHLVPGSSQEPGRYVELEGAADLIVEIVSDSSVGKDTRRLPEAYSKAGVREFWLADARNGPVVFRIHQSGDADYQTVQPDADGFQPSALFGCSFRLDSRRTPQGYWVFDLREKD